MNPKLRYLLVAVLAAVEAFALAIAVPIVVLAIIAYGLLVCARIAGASVRDVAPGEHASATGAYDPAGS